MHQKDILLPAFALAAPHMDLSTLSHESIAQTVADYLSYNFGVPQYLASAAVLDSANVLERLHPDAFAFLSSVPTAQVSETVPETEEAVASDENVEPVEAAVDVPETEEDD